MSTHGIVIGSQGHIHISAKRKGAQGSLLRLVDVYAPGEANTHLGSDTPKL